MQFFILLVVKELVLGVGLINSVNLRVSHRKVKDEDKFGLKKTLER